MGPLMRDRRGSTSPIKQGSTVIPVPAATSSRTDIGGAAPDIDLVIGGDKLDPETVIG